MLGLLARRPPRHPIDDIPPESAPHFTFVVPAHNESSGIEGTVGSLNSVDYPKGRYSVVVVADNCSDDTAERAAVAGARVITRNDASRRGKGYALELAFQVLIDEATTDAVVVVDADTDVASNLLRSAAEKMAQGAKVMQAHYAVRNVDESWRTRLMDVAFTLYHGVRSHARERMGVSAGLRGNGMVFTLDTLRSIPYGAYSLVEDVEYGIELGLKGIRVAYLGDAEVRAEMVTSGAASESQRKRWEQGRSQMLRQFLPRLVSRGIAERDWILLDLACDMLVPPLATVAGYTAVGVAGATTAVATGLAAPLVLAPWILSVAGLSAYVGSGIALSGRGLAVMADLVHVPKYVLWKMTLPIRGRRKSSGEWIRTARKGEVN